MAPPVDLTLYLLLSVRGGIGLQELSAPVAPAVSFSTTAKSVWAYDTPAATAGCGQCALEIDS